MKAVSYNQFFFRGSPSLSTASGAIQELYASGKTPTNGRRRDPIRRQIHGLIFVGMFLAPLIAASAPAPMASTTPPASAWKFTGSAAIKETFDSNVYLQSETDKAEQASLVTSLLPQATVAWKPAPVFGVTLAYAPEVTFFHSEDSEDFVAHRVTLALSGKKEQTAYESTTSLVFIDGSSVSPTWTGPGGAPATGGPAVRDRRDAAVYRSSFRVTQQFGAWFVRPVFSLYVHDFLTEHRATPGYQNSVDRDELVGGVDLGRSLTDQVSWFVGYRYGVQDQSQLFGVPVEYDNTFHRGLVGLEGQPAIWLKLSLALGPEFRRYGPNVPAAFGDRDELNLFVDASVTVIPSKADAVTLSVKQFKQPGFGGRSVYEDFTGDLSWKRKFNQRWTAGLGGRAYNTDFMAPVVRNDWVLSANAFVNCAVNAHLSTEVSYVFEDGLTRDSNAAGRKYVRHLVALGCKYNF